MSRSSEWPYRILSVSPYGDDIRWYETTDHVWYEDMTFCYKPLKLHKCWRNWQFINIGGLVIYSPYFVLHNSCFLAGSLKTHQA